MSALERSVDLRVPGEELTLREMELFCAEARRLGFANDAVMFASKRGAEPESVGRVLCEEPVPWPPVAAVPVATHPYSPRAEIGSPCRWIDAQSLDRCGGGPLIGAHLLGGEPVMP